MSNALNLASSMSLAVNGRYSYTQYLSRQQMFILCFFVLCSQVLFNQFKYFYNLYFLLLACSQFIKELRLGALYTYWVPLVCDNPQSFVAH